MTGKVTTWADAFGIWRAAVPLSGSRHRDALTARRAILVELEARYAPNFDPRFIRVTLDHVKNHGVAVYREELNRRAT